MLKKSSTKSALITALLTSNVIWGGTIVYVEEPSYVRPDGRNGTKNGNTGFGHTGSY